MNKFDTIDMFFIAIIGAYFITLFCIIITIIYIKISKIINYFRNRKKNKLVQDEVKEQLATEPVKKPKKETKEAKVQERKSKEPKVKKEFKLSDIAIIRKLFLKEIKEEPANPIILDKPKDNKLESGKTIEAPSKEEPKELKEKSLEPSLTKVASKKQAGNAKAEEKNTSKNEKANTSKEIKENVSKSKSSVKKKPQNSSKKTNSSKTKTTSKNNTPSKNSTNSKSNKNTNSPKNNKTKTSKPTKKKTPTKKTSSSPKNKKTTTKRKSTTKRTIKK